MKRKQKKETDKCCECSYGYPIRLGTCPVCGAIVCDSCLDDHVDKRHPEYMVK